MKIHVFSLYITSLSYPSIDIDITETPHYTTLQSILLASPVMAATSSVANFAKRLQGKVALITGGASGIGESTAKLFAKHGAKVVIADVQDELGYSLAKTIGQSSTYIHCNVAHEPDVQNAVDAAVSLHGKLDIMYNNAGITGNYTPTISSITRDDYDKVLDINLYGAMLGAKHAARVMTASSAAGGGCILFTASVAAVSFGEVPHPYCASKSAIVGLTKNLCVELGQYGIRVNCVSPGAIPTPTAAKAMGFDDLRKVQETVAKVANLKGVMVNSDDVANAVLYLGSDEARYVSGLNVVIDGGFSLRSLTLGL
ncbi:Short chain aldehyde dehydrogenase 1 [Linum grandiflorum]